MRIKCRRFKEKFRNSKCCCTICAAAAGLLVIIILISGFSLLISCFDASDDLVSCMAAIALCAGSFAAGFIIAKRRRRHGLLTGLCAGVFIYRPVSGTFMKLILILLCSCIGGVCGVNTRICKPPK